VFLLTTAVAAIAVRSCERVEMDAERQRAREALRSATSANSIAVTSALANPALYASAPAGGWVADLLLVAAVAVGAVLRRVAKRGAERVLGDESSPQARAPSESVLARVRRLESAHDRAALAATRTARDLSKVATRVRLVRRELSSPLRKVEAESAAREAEAAALEQRVNRLGDELRLSQRTVDALRGVTAKQFDALAGALTDLKKNIRRIDAEKAEEAEKTEMANASEASKEATNATRPASTSARDSAATAAPTSASRTKTPEVADAGEAEEPAAAATNAAAAAAGGNVMRVQRRRSLTFRVGSGGGAAKRDAERGASHGITPKADESAGEAEASKE
jgi:hypothetical protein